jgi:hypothetical protein
MIIKSKKSLGSLRNEQMFRPIRVVGLTKQEKPASISKFLTANKGEK